MRKRAALLVVLLLLVGLFDVRAQSQGLCTPGTFWRHSVGRLLHTRMLSLPLKLQPQFGRDTPPHLGGGNPRNNSSLSETKCDPPSRGPRPALSAEDGAILAETPWHLLAPMHRVVEDPARRCARRNAREALASLRSGAVDLALRSESLIPPVVRYAAPPPIAPRPTIPLFWINLPGEGQSATRRRVMREQLSRLGWTEAGLEHSVEAVDGRFPPLSEEGLLMPSSAFLNLSALPCHLRVCSSREVATLLSHVKALRQAFADGAPMALVAEDDVDLSLFDEGALREQILPRRPWSSVQLYSGNTHILGNHFQLPPGAVPVDFQQTAWGHALTLYSRRGMAEILDAFGGRDPDVHGGRFRIPHPVASLAAGAAFQFEADWILKLLVSRPMISTRPMANVFVAESTIDNFNRKGTGADVVIGNYSSLLLGAGRAALYGSAFEIQRTARHLRAIATAFDAGASSVIVSEDELNVAQVRLAPLAAALRAAKAQGANTVVQLVTSNVAAFDGRTEDKSDPRRHIVPRPDAAIGGALFYAVVGRKAMGRFAALWQQNGGVTVPAGRTFIADAFIFHNGVKAVYAPHVFGSTAASVADWMGFNSLHRPRRLAGTCQACPAGYQQGYQHYSYCNACPRGYFTADKGNTECDWCPTGKVGPEPGTVNCQLCLAGQFQHLNGAWCNNCSAGKFQNEDGQRECKDCPTGWRRLNTTAGTNCDACEAGRFRSSELENVCDMCAPGRFASEAGSDSCMDCAAGRFAKDSAATHCAACPVGWHRHWNYPERTSCLECGAGKFQSQEGQHVCHSCVSGQFQSVAGSALCRDCEPGKFSAADQAEGCADCPGGSISTARSAACRACGAGQYRHDKTTCTVCPSGRYTGSNLGGVSLDAACKLCAPGKFKDNPTCTPPCALCDKCAPGKHQDQKGKTSCKPCGAGETAAIEAAVLCTKCAAGKYLTAEMAASSAAAAGCLPCAAATTSGATSCDGCPAGSFGNSLANTCQACPLGRFSTGGDSCDQCDNHTAQDGCKACPIGWFGLSEPPRYLCVECGAGTWSSTLQAQNGSACEKCNRGKYSAVRGATTEETCTECPPGTRNPHEGADHPTRCEQCPIGFYSLDTAARWAPCVGCVPGRFNAQRGAFLGCDGCPKGRHQASANSSTCEACLPGRSLSRTGQAVCEGCAPGMYAAATAQERCDECPRGFLSEKLGQASCLPCIPGRYSEFSGQTACKECRRNTFSASVNSSSCVDCPRGRWTSRPGSAICTPCGQGKYVVDQQCADCPRGFAQDQIDKLACEGCAPGQFAVIDRLATCSPCAMGSYQAYSNASACDKCPAGFYSDAGAKSCAHCPLGKSALKGSASCFECDRGKFGMNGSQFGGLCEFCPMGWYADAKGQLACSDCDLGEKYEAATQPCTSCELGQYGIANGVCTDCPSGTYQDARRATSCLDCPADTSFSGDAATSRSQCTFCRPDTTTGGRTGQSNASACRCNRGEFYQEGDSCKTCPDGADCSGKDGVSIAEIFPKPGFWRATLDSEAFASCEHAYTHSEVRTFARKSCCPVVSTGNGSASYNLCDLSVLDGDDPKNGSWDPSQQCATGYTGALCMICDANADYIRVGHECVSCPGGPFVASAVGALFLLSAILGFGVFICVRTFKEPKNVGESDHHYLTDHFQGSLIILLSYTQILSCMVKTYSSVSWPAGFTSMTESLFVAQLDFAFLMPMVSCNMSLPFETKMLLHLITPIALGAASVGATRLAICSRGSSSMSPRSRKAQINFGLTVVILIGMMIYPSVTIRVFSAFRCYSVPGVGSLMELDFAVGCFEDDTSGKHAGMVMLALAGLVFYTLGFPLYLLISLWRVRHVLHNTEHSNYVMTKLRLGSLYCNYEPWYWFWEPVVMVYKMLMVGALSVIEQHSPVQLFLGFLVSAMYMCITLRSAPYIDPNLDRLSFTCSLSLGMTIFLALLKAVDQHRAIREDSMLPWEVHEHTLGTTMMILNLVPFAQAVGGLIITWALHRKKIAADVSHKVRKLKSRLSRKPTTTPELVSTNPAKVAPATSNDDLRNWRSDSEVLIEQKL